MRSSLKPVLLAATFVVAHIAVTADVASGRDTEGTALAIARPCGPNNAPNWVRRLIPQGAYGADFRPSCRRHDKCYRTAGTTRKQCDDRWRDQMFAACNCSRHPIACRCRARLMHRVTRMFGQDAYDAAQKKYAGKN